MFISVGVQYSFVLNAGFGGERGTVEGWRRLRFSNGGLWTYQDRGLVRLHSFASSVGADQGVPDCIVGGLRVVIGDGEEGTVPAGHAVRLFVAEDEVVEEILCVAAAAAIIVVGVLEESGVDFTAFVNGGSDVDLSISCVFIV